MPENHLRRLLRGMPPFLALLRSIEARLLDGWPWERPILDLGCGDGYFTSTVFDRPVEMGVDPSSTALSDARRRGIHRLLAQASGTALPCADGAFATVLANCVIEHIPDVDGTLTEIARVLRPGGTFVTTVPTDRFTGALLGTRLFGERYGRWWNRRSVHYHLDAPRVWRERLHRAGLRVVREERYFSPQTVVVFELFHYLSVHTLLLKPLIRRRVLWPDGPGVRLTERILYAHYLRDAPQDGVNLLLVCRKDAEERTTLERRESTF
ncbi:MAG: class I SAM-dependent methyltransferase [Chloroflexi bacterium]|nr:class I SAM-dependent methyltransferase [Chloroflexota bacterium]